MPRRREALPRLAGYLYASQLRALTSRNTLGQHFRLPLRTRRGKQRHFRHVPDFSRHFALDLYFKKRIDACAPINFMTLRLMPPREMHA